MRTSGPKRSEKRSAALNFTSDYNEMNVVVVKLSLIGQWFKQFAIEAFDSFSFRELDNARNFLDLLDLS